MSKMDSVSDNSVMVMYKIEGESLTMSEPTGQSYVAKLDGTEAPFKGDPGLTTVSVKRIDKDTIQETDKRNGKAIFTVHMTISADGKSLAFTSQETLNAAPRQESPQRSSRASRRGSSVLPWRWFTGLRDLPITLFTINLFERGILRGAAFRSLETSW
jgi:hypothetical protein